MFGLVKKKNILHIILLTRYLAKSVERKNNGAQNLQEVSGLWTFERMEP